MTIPDTTDNVTGPLVFDGEKWTELHRAEPGYIAVHHPMTALAMHVLCLQIDTPTDAEMYQAAL